MDTRSRTWPWFGHRSLAEVAETDRLVARKVRGERLPFWEDERLDTLLCKAQRHNPPPADVPDVPA